MLLNDITIKVSTTAWQTLFTDEELEPLAAEVKEILETKAAEIAFLLTEMGLETTVE